MKAKFTFPLFVGKRGSLLFLAMALCSAFATAQTNQVVWLNGKVMYGHPITTIDSITYDMNGMLEGDTLSLILPRSTRYVVHDTVTVVKKDTVYVKDTVYINKCGSEGIGVFSVSADKQVSFSKGNLQYQASTKTWRFAEHQYDYIGEDNANISDTYTGWIDLFGWGTGNYPTNTSTDYGDYSTFVDLGCNIIGTDIPNTWRTLSSDEWHYLFYTRTNAQKLFAFGSVNGVYGVIILPEDWITPSDVVFTPSTENGLMDKGEYYWDNHSHWLDNTYVLSEWQKMENAGAVFLPASGGRYGQDVSNWQFLGAYWSNTLTKQCGAYLQYFFEYTLYPRGTNVECYNGYAYSVRLVQDL